VCRLREKLKHFTQQYDLREQHFAHQLRTKALEQQLVEAKLKQQQELGAQEETKVTTPPPLCLCEKENMRFKNSFVEAKLQGLGRRRRPR
jgi:hypothetical protein